MLAAIRSATLLGVDGRPVAVEVHVSNGLPGFHVVGLPDAACRESRDRVRAALLSTGYHWPLRRITVNLAPSGVRKGGAGLDLPIAVALLVALGEVPAEPATSWSFLGELGLDGSLRRVTGVVPLVDAMPTTTVVVPTECAVEAALVPGHDVRGAPTLGVLLEALRGVRPWPDLPVPEAPSARRPGPDLCEVRGHAVARLALEVSAAGGHHLLMVGPPGSGKTMLARRIPGLLPPLEPTESMEATRIRSAAGIPLPVEGLVAEPPFQAPHHSASMVSIIGGGAPSMRPGQVSLAHGGVLFLDEMGEFAQGVLDALRQPLEEGVVRVCRARASVTFPARFLLVSAMNPCPCGEGGPAGWCRCTPAARSRYARRLSGPLLDRFDLRVTVVRPEVDELLSRRRGEASSEVAGRVAEARRLARRRGFRCNADLPSPRLDELVPLTAAAEALLEHALRVGNLSVRGFERVRRVARTLADLSGATGAVGDEHVCTALTLRAEQLLEAVPV